MADNNYKYLFSIVFLCIALVGCSATKFDTGDNFYSDIWAGSNVPTYKKEGKYEGYDFYTVLPQMQQYQAQSGVLVKNETFIRFDQTRNREVVVQPLTAEDVQTIRSSIANEKQKQNETIEDFRASSLKIIKENNLKIIYEFGNFIVTQNASNQDIYLKDGVVVAPIEVKTEIQEYNNYLTLANAQKPVRQINTPRNWRVQAGPPQGKNTNNCRVKDIKEGTRDQSGNVVFRISFECRRGSAGNSGVGQVICGEGLSNYTNSNSYYARCY